MSSAMAVPPSYSDLGKAAKDIFSKGYGKFSGLNVCSKLLHLLQSVRWPAEVSRGSS